MTWLATKMFLKKAWIWTKAHWQVPAILLWSVVVYIFSRRNSDAIIEVLNAKKDSYKQQIDVITKAHNEEIIKRENLIKKYEKIIKAIEDDFKKKEKELTETQKEIVKDVIVKSRKNPEEIRRIIEEEFGIRYVE